MRHFLIVAMTLVASAATLWLEVIRSTKFS